MMNPMNMIQNNNINNINQNVPDPGQKPIINNTIISNIKDASFYNLTLQALSSLKYINIWINLWNNNKQKLFIDNNLKITKEIFILYSALYTKQIPDSSNFILNYNNKVKEYYQGNINNAIDFLYYLIKIIHIENNYPPNPNQNMEALNHLQLYQKINDDYVRNLFTNLLKQSQKSIISTYFYTVLRCKFNCKNCPINNQITYAYYYKYMLKFYINDYYRYRNQSEPDKKQMKLTLDKCFECYTGGYKCKCQICGNPSTDYYYSIYSVSKILVIGLIRNNHCFLNDLDFPNILDINPYCKAGNYSGMKYSLKACISLNNENKYFSDIYLGNYWFRFYQNQCIMLSDVGKDIKTFEPQILIYELNENNNNNNINMSQMQQVQQVNPMFSAIHMSNMNFNMMMPGYGFQGIPGFK